MKVCAFDGAWDAASARQYGVARKTTAEDVLRVSDVVSLHMNLSDQNRGLINRQRLGIMKEGAYIVNTARGALVVEEDVAEALKSKLLGGYGTDVVEPEPILKTNPLLSAPNVVFTPHIGSRTYESVERQALMSAENMIRKLHGEPPHFQANKV